MNVRRVASTMAAIACLAVLSACAAKPPAKVAAIPAAARENGRGLDVITVLPKPRPVRLTAPEHKVCSPDYHLFNGKCLSRLESWHLRGTI